MIIKYKHRETGLYLTKKKHGYSSVYFLSEKGTIWQRRVMGSLSMTKDPFIYGLNQWFNSEDFTEEIFDIIKKHD